MAWPARRNEQSTGGNQIIVYEIIPKIFINICIHVLLGPKSKHSMVFRSIYTKTNQENNIKHFVGKYVEIH